MRDHEGPVPFGRDRLARDLLGVELCRERFPFDAMSVDRQT
jgi:hypothetical protein